MYSTSILLILCFSLEQTLTASIIETADAVSKFNAIKTETDNQTSLIDSSFCGKDENSIYNFPWLVSFVAFGWPLCSGALINPRYVLTTAHCANASPTEIIIRAGDLNLKNNNTNCTELTGADECVLIEDFHIDKQIIHPLFNINSSYTEHSVGLVRLDRAVTYKEHIRPVCLPKQNPISPNVGETLYTSAWGIIFDPEIGKERMKYKYQSTLITNGECKEQLKMCNVPKINEYVLSDNNACLNFIYVVGFGEVGGSVMTFHENQWRMEGILINSRDACATEPLIYIKISPYIEWIEATVRDLESNQKD